MFAKEITNNTIAKKRFILQTNFSSFYFQTDATVEIQTTPLYPYLERYTDMLRQEIDYKTGFNFGPQNLIPRRVDDFTK